MNTNPMLSYILARLGEASTYRGIFALLTAVGLALKPEQAAAITSAGLALIGVINVFKKDAVSVVPWTLALLSCLLLPSCGTTADGQKTFLGITGQGWLATSEAAVAGALPTALNERAKTAAKNPTHVSP